MAEPQEPAEPQTAPAPELAPASEAQSEPAETQETPTYLTKEDAQVLIEATLTERESALKRDIDAAYKTLRRGEAKSDTAQQRIGRLESKLEELVTRDMSPEQARIWKLERQVEHDAETRGTQTNPEAELAAFRSEASSILEEEGIKAEDPVLVDAFNKRANGWQSGADLRVALTRAVADVHRAREKTARAESSEREKKAREEERAKLRNEKRQEEGKVDKGTAAPASATAKPKSALALSQEEWDALKAQRGIRG